MYLLDSEGAEDGPEVALQRLQDGALDLVFLLAQELLRGRVQQLGVLHDLHLQQDCLQFRLRSSFFTPLTWATPVTVRGTPWAVSTFSQIGFRVITSRDSLQGSACYDGVQAAGSNHKLYQVTGQNRKVNQNCKNCNKCEQFAQLWRLNNLIICRKHVQHKNVL